ncbi:hypothetical protein [Teredinibacter turnerae]|uniref:hypothetical protein n=1 Tax=Teredinibacter turnerae TaxID=2426 RepID=UPI00048C84A9|nr:hypothetical protein [Teredinibacter turnerae]
MIKSILCSMALILISCLSNAEVKRADFLLTQEASYKEGVRGGPELNVYNKNKNLVFFSRGLTDKYALNARLRSVFLDNDVLPKVIGIDQFNKENNKHFERYTSSIVERVNASYEIPEGLKKQAVESSLQAAEAAYKQYSPKFSTLSKKIEGSPDIDKLSQGSDYIFVQYTVKSCLYCEDQIAYLEDFFERNQEIGNVMWITVDRTLRPPKKATAP